MYKKISLLVTLCASFDVQASFPWETAVQVGQVIVPAIVGSVIVHKTYAKAKEGLLIIQPLPHDAVLNLHNLGPCGKERLQRRNCYKLEEATSSAIISVGIGIANLVASNLPGVALRNAGPMLFLGLSALAYGAQCQFTEDVQNQIVAQGLHIPRLNLQRQQILEARLLQENQRSS